MSSPRRSTFAFAGVLLAIAVVGCGSSSATPTAPPLTDPNEIITRSATGLTAVQTVHFDVAVSGSVNTSALGSSGSALGLSGSLKLDGTTASGDIDIQKQAFHVAASMPTLLGLTADIIQVDGFQYTKISLVGTKYTKSSASTLPIPSAAPSATLDISSAVTSLKSSLTAAGVTATLVGRDQVDGRNSYHVSVGLPKDLINQQLGALGGAAAGGAKIDTLTLDYWVFVDSLNPAKMELKASSVTVGNLTVTLTLTKYNQPVTIKAPADSEIQASQ
ncbi:MAG TPA: LppX_LprAFG lipoprotein [Thermoleophilia bacterium]